MASSPNPTRDEFAEALEGHEVFQKQSSSSGGSGGVSVEDIEEEDEAGIVTIIIEAVAAEIEIIKISNFKLSCS